MGPHRGASAIGRGDFGGPAWLAMLFLLLALGLRHYPTRSEVDAFTSLDLTATPDREQLWVTMAQRCLHLCILQPRPQVEFIQASLLFCVYASMGGLTVADEDQRGAFDEDEEGEERPELTPAGPLAVRFLKMAILHAQELGLHRLKSSRHGDRRPFRTEATLQREMGRRIWWALCFRDWSHASPARNRVASISLRDFTTPLPGNYNDEDLTPKEGELLGEPKDRDTLTEMSYVLAILDYIVIAKDHCEVQQQAAGCNGVQVDADAMASVAARYQNFIGGLPRFYHADVTVTQEASFWCRALEVQKWLLQSAIFSR